VAQGRAGEDGARPGADRADLRSDGGAWAHRARGGGLTPLMCAPRCAACRGPSPSAGRCPPMRSCARCTRRSAKAGAAIAIVTVDMLLIHRPAAFGNRGTQPVKLLLDGLRLGLADSRHPRIHRCAHQAPPRRSAPGRADRPARPSALTAGRRDPTGARRRGAERAGGRRPGTILSRRLPPSSGRSLSPRHDDPPRDARLTRHLQEFTGVHHAQPSPRL
jgi:hypothetical protein